MGRYHPDLKISAPYWTRETEVTQVSATMFPDQGHSNFI
jgi:hypothetical protein